ncbi:MAG: hypothetical protein AAF657_40780, partial [Acidobacteriota bacterium]
TNDSLRLGRLQSRHEQRLAAELFAPSTWQALSHEMVNGSGSTRSERSIDILHQELRAAAAYQAVLLQSGLVDEALDPEQLTELLALPKLEDFAEGYLELLARTYGLELAPLAVA